jgi:hypothetical protein
MIDDELSAQQPATRPNSRPQPSRQANDNGTAAPPSNSGLPNASEAQFKKMSEAQRGLLFRLAGERGVAPPEQESWILQQLGAQSLTSVSRFAASQAIDRLTVKKPNGANGSNSTSGPAVH